MSDHEEASHTSTPSPSGSAASTSLSNHAPVIRYSKDMLLSLHDSPLVSKPDTMPSLSVWFGEDPSSANKAILNGAVIPRAIDKSIVLGPPKTNFASSLYGGLKRSEDNALSKPSYTSSSSFARHRQTDESRNRDYGLKEHRPLRGPSHVGEKGFPHRDRERRTSTHGPSSQLNSKRHPNDRFNDRSMNGDTPRGRREYSRDAPMRGNRPHGQGSYNDSERVPEWLDYSPEAEEDETKGQATTLEEDDAQAKFANDLEAWKSSMKKRDLDEAGKTSPSMPQKPIDAVDQVFSSAPLEAPFATPPSDGLVDSFFDSNLSPMPAKGGSRFAKFFAKREESSSNTSATPVNEMSPAADSPSNPKSITLNDLFKGGSPTVRALSEEDVLRSLGASKSPSQESQSISPAENAMGFNRVLQILSQPKPIMTTSGKSSPSRRPLTLADIENQTKEMHIRSPKQDKQETYSQGTPSPRFGPAPALDKTMANQENQETENKDTTPAHKPKNVTSRFAGNLPTSVLRQMSAKSSESRSPSIVSSKSVTPGRTLANESPLIGNRSPGLKSSIGSSSPQQGGTSVSSPGFYAYNNHAYHQPMSSTSGYPMGHAPPVMDTNGNRPPRDTAAFEQLLRYTEGMVPVMQPGAQSMMNPMMAPPIPFTQNQTHSPSQAQHPSQHQQNNHPQQPPMPRSSMDMFLPPHMMPPMPPMPPGAARPMMPPPHQLPSHLQGQMPPRFPMQPDMMPPLPGDFSRMNMAPPHVMANGNGAGMPPIVFGKNEGWNRH
ncbi:uncharacterized protein BYT42DRAFT_352312 [Radiomyces spectabilis]|uniref:uncharacterized protein n=1 Tax=Radiomyces spectabilis TaxID=64574 RepID=UPI00221E6072|nr:uncharacterized protein BYT42DRAFT_352312 [Radiomyces spectabilis]KAI8377664.1 hypothetical protein BYT42DRAFT_352312 [Radiomyces spectabilis]